MNFKFFGIIYLPFVFLFFFPAGAQTCLPEGMHFERQSQIDSFPINYPGCTVIEGSICIGDCQWPYVSTDIKNLDGLVQLTSVGGNIQISSNPFLKDLEGLNNLSVIEQNILINNNDSLLSLDGLQQITKVKGSFTLRTNHFMTSISGFESIDTIIGSLHIDYMGSLITIDAFSNLKYLGTFNIDGNPNLLSVNDLMKLETLGNFYLNFNRIIADLPDFPNLSEVQGDFLFTNNIWQEHIEGYESIRRIGGSLELSVTVIEDARRSSAMTINAFHNLTSIGGDLNIYFDDIFFNIDGFTQLDTVGGDLLIDLELASQNFMLPNRFKYIGGHIQLSGILNVQDMQCFANLDTLHGNFSLVNCQALESLTGLEDIKWMKGYLRLINLDNLLSLEGIQNIDPQSFQSLSIYGNQKLQVCNLPNICTALHVYMKPYNISGNGSECLNIQNIHCYDHGLSGIVFFDNNQNKVQDQNDIGIPGILISAEPDDILLPTNNRGKYLLIAEEGSTHTLQIDLNPDWILTTDSVSYTRTFNEGLQSNKNNNFGIFPATEEHELAINLSSDVTRCNETVKFYLHAINTGSVPEKSSLTLTYDPKVMFKSSTPPADSHNVSLHELHWDLDTLYPYHERKVTISFKMPNESSTGELLEFEAIAYRDSADIVIEADTYNYTPEVRCSFDPNDKLVMPAGIRDENYTLTNSELTYTVRFENTGNAEAINITIIDTLDAGLDLSTFRVINSSHTVFTSLDGNEVKFFFENIWLAEKKTGFVTYAIRPLAEVQEFTSISNQAHIIFDFNQPIVTNITLNTLVDEICEDVTMIIDTSICSGENFLGFTETGIYLDTTQIGSICDSFTQIHLNVYDNEIIQLDTSICQGESYLGYDTSGVYVFNSINHETGCTQTTFLTLNVLPIGSGPCITGTQIFSGQNLIVYPNPTDGDFYIEADRDITSLILYSMDSRFVVSLNYKLNGRYAHVEINEALSCGMYILEIELKGRKMYRKIAVSR